MSYPQLFLFGFPRIEYEGNEIKLDRRKALALIAYLGTIERRSSRDTLATFFWPEYDSVRARAGLRRVLTDINNTPLSNWLLIDREMIALKDDFWIDLKQFNALASKGDPDSLEECINLYQDDFMAGFTLRDSAEFDLWQAEQTQFFQQKLLKILEQLSQYYLSEQNIERAISVIRRWVNLDPFHEIAQMQLVRLYMQVGQRGTAITQYNSYVRLLDEELGIQPSHDMAQLYEEVKSNQLIPQTVLRGILPSLPSLVVGRLDTLDDIKKCLGICDNQAEDRQVILQGLPGIGKTTLTSLLAHDKKVQQAFPDGVLWASLGESPDLLNVLVAWGRALGLPDVNQTHQIEEMIAKLTVWLHDKSALLLIDDVWDAHHAIKLKMGGKACGLVITTRLNSVAQALASHPEMLYKVPVLSDDVALALLQKLAPKTVEEHPAEALELVHDLEGLPLAIQVAGRLLNAEMKLGWGVVDLLEELRSGARLLQAQAPPDPYHGQPMPTVAALLQRSIAHLPPDLQEKFAVLGVFAPKPATFTLAAMQAVWAVQDAKPIVRTLVDRGLLEPASRGHFQMHALLVMQARSMFQSYA